MMKTNHKAHKHIWVVSSVAIILAVALIIIIPQKKVYSAFFVGLAGSHILILLISAFTGWLLLPEKFLKKIRKRKPIEGFDFGWSTKWLYGFLLASILTFLVAIHLYFNFEGSDAVRLLIFSLLLLLSVNFFIGNRIMSNSNRTSQITLPMVNLLPESSKGKVLDAGCGAGRTSVALGCAFPDIQITSFDRFDAYYIDDGGTNLLKRNLSLAGIDSRVNIVAGDITHTPFEKNSFDAVVSSFMFDHLGDKKLEALKETYRILKPGGRVLLVIAVRGAITFGIANLLCLMFPSRTMWKKWIKQTGFNLVSEGVVNEGTYFCFEKPNNKI